MDTNTTAVLFFFLRKLKSIIYKHYLINDIEKIIKKSVGKFPFLG
jgi:hypothetical protein